MPTDVTRNFIRKRKQPARLFDKRSFRVKPTRRGKAKLVLACEKGKWNAKKKRCRVPMQVQSIMFPRKGKK